MKVHIIIPYGDRTEVLEPDGLDCRVTARPVPRRDSISDAALRRSIEEPSAGPSLREFLKGSRRLLVVVNDGTRKTATSRVLAAIRPFLTQVDYQIVIASGAHRRPDGEDLERILGPLYPELRERVVFHDAREPAKMVYLGRSTRGTDLIINSLAVRSDRILVITSVEPHYFAGFMGGRKSFLPGLASCETIIQNHRLSLHRMARAFSLRRNPVHNDMMEVLDYLDCKKIFSIQLLQDASGRILDALSGDIRHVFFTLAASARKLHGARIGRRADILLTVVSEPELSLYETRKAISYGMLGLKRDGILIVVSPCRKGLGNPDFFDPIIASRSPRNLLRQITEDFRLGHQRLAKWVEAPLWGEIWLVSELPAKRTAGTFLKPYDSVRDACADALKKKGRSARLAIVFDGTKSIPIPE